MARGQDLDTRFWQLVDVGDQEECWPWLGMTTSKGYGRIRNKGRKLLAHRVAYELTFEESIGDFCACHKCDNPICVNPFHIFLGTKSDNNKDRATKGRGACGTKTNTSKLNEDDVRFIRKNYAYFGRGGMSQPQLAQKFGVLHAEIGNIIRGKTWRWLT